MFLMYCSFYFQQYNNYFGTSSLMVKYQGQIKQHLHHLQTHLHSFCFSQEIAEEHVYLSIHGAAEKVLPPISHRSGAFYWYIPFSPRISQFIAKCCKLRLGTSKLCCLYESVVRQVYDVNQVSVRLLVVAVATYSPHFVFCYLPPSWLCF